MRCALAIFTLAVCLWSDVGSALPLTCSTLDSEGRLQVVEEKQRLGAICLGAHLGKLRPGSCHTTVDNRWVKQTIDDRIQLRLNGTDDCICLEKSHHRAVNCSTKAKCTLLVNYDKHPFNLTSEAEGSLTAGVCARKKDAAKHFDNCCLAFVARSYTDEIFSYYKSSTKDNQLKSIMYSSVNANAVSYDGQLLLVMEKDNVTSSKKINAPFCQPHTQSFLGIKCLRFPSAVDGAPMRPHLVPRPSRTSTTQSPVNTKMASTPITTAAIRQPNKRSRIIDHLHSAATTVPVSLLNLVSLIRLLLFVLW